MKHSANALIPVLSAVLFGIVSVQAAASQVTTGSPKLMVTDLKVVPTRGNLKISAAYAKITNNGTSVRTLTSVTSAIAGKIELHTTLRDGNIMRMRRLDKGIAAKPGETVELKRGGLHIMLMKLKQPIRSGDPVTLTFVFDNGTRITQTARAAVIPATTRGSTSVQPRGSDAGQPRGSH